VELVRPTAIVTAILLLGIIPLSSVLGGPPSSGDWIVSREEEAEDRSIEVDGDLVIKGGATLSLYNIDLRMGGGSEIVVESGGKLHIVDTRIGSGGYSITVRGEMEGWGSIISGAESKNDGGLRVEGGSLHLSNSSVTRSGSSAIAVREGQLELSSVEISDSSGKGLSLLDSEAKMDHARIWHNQGTGIQSYGSKIEMTDCTISENSRTGIVLSGGTTLIGKGQIVKNGGNGIETSSDPTELNVISALISGNSGWGVLSSLSDVQLNDVDWAKPSPNSLGGFLDRDDELDVRVEIPGSDLDPSGFTVRLVPSVGPERFGTTDERGIAYFRDVERTVIDGTGEHSRMPYAVIVSGKVRNMNLSGGIPVLGEEMWSDHGIECQLTLPDIEVRGANARIDGRRMEFSATLFNNWTTELPAFGADLYDGGKRIANQMIGPIGPCSEKEVRFSIDLPRGEGDHDLRLVLDPSDEIPESDETDNEVSRTVNVRGNPISLWAIPILILAAILGLGFISISRSYRLKKMEMTQRESEGSRNSVRPKDPRDRSPARKGGSRRR
jgi:hypothetical protein